MTRDRAFRRRKRRSLKSRVAQMVEWFGFKDVSPRKIGRIANHGFHRASAKHNEWTIETQTAKAPTIGEWNE